MKPLLFVTIFLTQTMVFALTRKEACRVKSVKKTEMNISASNIANLNTTRTPDGGPYQRQSYVCNEGQCSIAKSTKFILKLMPEHPDADHDGFVKFPDVDLKKEMEDIIAATKAYEAAEKDCPTTSEEACDAALEEKATYKFLITKLSKDPEIDMTSTLDQIKRTSLDYKNLNSFCKR